MTRDDSTQSNRDGDRSANDGETPTGEQSRKQRESIAAEPSRLNGESTTGNHESDHSRSDERNRLVDSLEASGTVTDERVLDAMRTVPRHVFVPSDRRKDAYLDRALPIADGQTISAPHMVGIMAELLDVGPGDRVLEIGTGCGYHAAVTAELVGPENVFSVEYSETLAERARQRLDEGGYDGVSIRTGDGRDGWPEKAPFESAYATCALPSFPDSVVDQVRTGGIVLAPIETTGQDLIRARKREDGTLERHSHGPVRFVRIRG